jgi:DNA-binding MarR family transcriptional regulator
LTGPRDSTGVLHRPDPGPDKGAARPTMGEIGLNHFAPYLMNRVIARWNANLAEALKGHDVSTVKMRVLAVLSVTGGLTINELSVFAVTEPSTMSRTLDAMEGQGLIRREQRAGDLRVREISITEDGRRLFDLLWPTMHDMFGQMFEGVGEAEYQGFIATLRKVLLNIRQHQI